MPTLHRTIVRPLVTEKTSARYQTHGEYVFEVAKDATKPAIRQAIEKLFGVKVVDVWTMTIAAGTGTGPGFYYLHTRAGSHVLTASATGATSGTQTVTVTPGPAAALAVTPPSAIVRARASQQFATSGTDAFGNPVPVSATWSLTPPTLGTLAPTTGSATTFTARRTLGRGTVTAAVATETGTISAAAGLRVAPGPLRIGSIRYWGREGAVLVAVTAIDGAGRPVSRAAVSLLVRRDGRRHVSARAATGAAGRAVYRVPARRGRCFVAMIRRISAPGFVWDGRTPRNRYCRPPNTRS